jgi:hypothetical protein
VLAKSRLESCFAVIFINLLALEPAEILDSASAAASADDTVLSGGGRTADAGVPRPEIDGVTRPFQEEATEGGRIARAEMRSDGTNTPHFGGHLK